MNVQAPGSNACSMLSNESRATCLVRAVVLVWLTSGMALAAAASEPRWPQFRGAEGAGVADGEKPPTHFGTGSNLLWQAELSSGSSSPCIWGDRIFLTTFSDGKLATLCVDRLDGHLRWQRTAPADKIEPFHPTGTRFDFLNKIPAPFKLLPGGYINTYDLGSGSSWNQINAEKDVPEYHMRPQLGSRRERRRLPGKQWISSRMAHRKKT